MEPDREYYVFASWIPTRTLRAIPRMFRGARLVREQLGANEDVFGFSLLARPLRNDYATLSVWRDARALRTFAGQQPHRRLVDELTPLMGETVSADWTIRGSDGVPGWPEALRRLR